MYIQQTVTKLEKYVSYSDKDLDELKTSSIKQQKDIQNLQTELLESNTTYESATGSRSKIDHFLITDDLTEQGQRCTILDDGCN